MANHPNRSKTQPTFHEGQQVEVYVLMSSGFNSWKPATIEGMHGEKYLVQFVNGSFGDFGTKDIKPLMPGQNIDRYAAFLNKNGA